MHFASVKLSELWKLVGERRSTWREREERRGEERDMCLAYGGLEVVMSKL